MFSVQAPANSWVNGVESEAQLITNIKEITPDGSTKVTTLSDSYEEAIQLAKSNDWQNAYLLARTMYLEHFIKLSELTKAQQLYSEILPLAQELKDDYILTRLAVNELSITSQLGDYSNIEGLINDVLESAESTEDKFFKSEIFTEIGRAYSAMNNNESAVPHFEKAYELAVSINRPIQTAVVLNEMATISRALRDYETAIKYFEEALSLTRSANDRFLESILLHNMGYTHYANYQDDLAVEYYVKSLIISEEIEDEIGVAWTNVSIADIYLAEDNWRGAIEKLANAFVIFEEVGDTQQQIHTLIGQASAYLNLNDLEQTKLILNKLAPYFETGEHDSLRVRYLQRKATYAVIKGDFEEAYEAIQEQSDLKSQLFEEKELEASQRYKALFDTKIKDDENRLLARENELNNIKIAQQQEQEKVWLIAMILIAALTIVIAVLLLVQTKNRNRFKSMAMRDHLTSSPNRRAVLNVAEDTFEQAKKQRRSLVIAIVDLDYFKKLNDTFGHDTGDKVLINFSRACEQELRQQDAYGRYGGEEWLFVFNDTDKKSICDIFERIKATLNNMPCEGLPEDYAVHFSMGAAQYNPKIDKNLNALIKRADQKLYEAKESGRDQCKI